MDRNNADVMKKNAIYIEYETGFEYRGHCSAMVLIITVVRQIQSRRQGPYPLPHQAEQRRYGLFSIRWQASTDGACGQIQWI